MSKFYPDLFTPRQLALAALLSAGTLSAQAQAPFGYTALSSLIGTSTYSDLGTNGTAIATPNNDDANSAATPIGFSFQYNGQTFTDFVLNTNGYIKLGTAAPVAPYFYDGPQSPYKGPLDNNAETNLILPFNLDLEGSATTEYRVFTTGTAPNRVCIIQWKDVSDKAAGNVTKQYSRANFQVRLYETLNQVDFLYGTFTANAGTTDALRTAAVGLKGSGPAAGQTLTMVKPSTMAWTGATFLAGNYIGDVFNVRSTVRPTSGLIYRFTASQPTDVSVQTIHTLGKISASYSLPHTVVAAVQNRGLNALTNVPVTLTVGGANTFTSTKNVPILSPGAIATVTFDAYPATLTEGTNNLTVTVPADDNNANNSIAYTQQVTAGNVAYTDDKQAFNASGVGVAVAGAGVAAKYTVTKPGYVNQLTARFIAQANNNATYQLVLFNANGTGGAPGTALYTSPVQTRTPAGGVVTVPVPSIAVTGSFYVSIREVSGVNPYLAYQMETPLRAGTFYFRTSSTAAWTDLTNSTLPYTRLALDATVGPQLSCPIATGAAFSNVTSSSATVTLSGVPSAGTGYTLVYGPAGFDPTAAGSTTATGTTAVIPLTGLTASTVYDVYVRANCGATDQSALNGPFRLTTAQTCPANTDVTAFPYAENFDAITPGFVPCGYTVVNANNDASTWQLAPTTGSTTGATAPNSMRYTWNAANNANDWFFTPALAVRAGSQYQVTFKYKTLVDPTVTTSEKLEVTYGATPTAAAQTTQLWKNEKIQNPTFTTAGATQVAIIKPTTDGNIYIGFHAYSDKDQYDLYVDDISITSATVTASSDALMRSITMFPNPTAGELSIDVKGVNTKSALQVEVTNMLGQRVHTAAIRNNFENKVNLSNLANGMYIVKVLAGNEYMVRNITIQK